MYLTTSVAGLKKKNKDLGNLSKTGYTQVTTRKSSTILRRKSLRRC